MASCHVFNLRSARREGDEWKLEVCDASGVANSSFTTTGERGRELVRLNRETQTYEFTSVFSPYETLVIFCGDISSARLIELSNKPSCQFYLIDIRNTVRPEALYAYDAIWATVVADEPDRSRKITRERYKSITPAIELPKFQA